MMVPFVEKYGGGQRISSKKMSNHGSKKLQRERSKDKLRGEGDVEEGISVRDLSNNTTRRKGGPH